MDNNRSGSALVVEGGGMRGIYAAGVLHAFGRAGFDPFNLYIGVSAGACHLASHLAGQNDRNFDITLRYSLDPRFISPGRFLRGGHLLDLDWMWDQTITHYRLNLRQIDEKLKTQQKDFLVVATSLKTGRALYLRPDQETLEHYLKVSSALPILYRRILSVAGEAAVDGGVADALPVCEAHRRGAADITVIRSRPASYVKKDSPLAVAFFAWYFKKYPALVAAFRHRADRYNESVKFLSEPPAGVRVTQIAPPGDLDIGRTTRNEAHLRRAYEAGVACGEDALRRR
ncbi:MAG: patatin family protein [Smithellaceae bacterium]|nr:patatin family protein [Smithellaceae bacterium]NLX52250.1 patatin family protein [Deltaproteobacteria bacterium]